jgi:hypothetical protein
MINSKVLRLTNDEILDHFDIIRTFKIKEVLPYRYGRISSFEKMETIDLMNIRNCPESIYMAYRMLHYNLAGEKADNHQVIICEFEGNEIIVKFSDYHVYMFYGAELIKKQF